MPELRPRVGSLLDKRLVAKRREGGVDCIGEQAMVLDVEVVVGIVFFGRRRNSVVEQRAANRRMFPAGNSSDPPVRDLGRSSGFR